MTALKPWRWLSRSRNISFDGCKAAYGVKMKQMPLLGIVCLTMLFVVYRTTNYQYQDTQMEDILQIIDIVREPSKASLEVKNLPHGIIQAHSDLELRPLWSSLKVDVPSHRNLLAISAGIKQKKNVDTIVQKFLAENFTVILFHMIATLMGGGIWIGMTTPYVLLLTTKQSGGLPSVFCILMLCPYMIMYLFGMKTWE
ncbi:hypothetical protein GIB67_025634 [Kingdonia uniflora]|uniref:Uncharacterized protein n=1 Tax=Kingdonia uniflora TaxID=39325 RepID=A0A7J7L8C9_9MAGN|nr:hypothetical protein GIB67_025634 [Kingdonia uniflora]